MDYSIPSIFRSLRQIHIESFLGTSENMVDIYSNKLVKNYLDLQF